MLPWKRMRVVDVDLTEPLPAQGLTKKRRKRNKKIQTLKKKLKKQIKQLKENFKKQVIKLIPRKYIRTPKKKKLLTTIKRRKNKKDKKDKK